MKIKIGKKVWLIVIIVIFVIALVSLGRIYFQQAGEQEQLSFSLASQKAQLSKLTTDKEALVNQLAQAESLFNTSRAKFSQSVESIEYGEDLFAIAADCNVELISLSPSKPIGRNIGPATYSVSSFVVKVKGNVDDILNFIQAIRIGEGFQLPWSTEVKGVNIDIDGSEATITLDIYAYKR